MPLGDITNVFSDDKLPTDGLITKETVSSRRESTSEFYGNVDDHERVSADDMDERRKRSIAYEYLCHLEEAKKWAEACIDEDLPPTSELEESLRNGVVLAKLAHFFSPSTVSLNKIYDKTQERFASRGLNFRHTDNINYWLASLKDINFPSLFIPETTDIYDKKNMPKVIYCLHALSLFLFKQGIAPQIQNLYGKVNFTEAEITSVQKELAKYGLEMPAFSKIGGILASEMPIDDAALHAAVIAINEALDLDDPSETLEALQNPAAHLKDVEEFLGSHYHDVLYKEKSTKIEAVQNRSLQLNKTVDAYDEMLTQAEIQGFILKVNLQNALSYVQSAIKSGQKSLLLKALSDVTLALRELISKNIDFYQNSLASLPANTAITRGFLQDLVKKCNSQAQETQSMEQAIKEINHAIRTQDEDQLLKTLLVPEAMLPEPKAYAASLYLDEFGNMMAEKEADLSYEELVGGLNVLNAIAGINEALDINDEVALRNALLHTFAHVSNVEDDDGLMSRYMQFMRKVKFTKQNVTPHCPLLSHADVQDCVDQVNMACDEEQDCLRFVSAVNQAVEDYDYNALLAVFKMKGGLASFGAEVNDRAGPLYLEILNGMKQQKLVDGESLWKEDILAAVARANQNASEAHLLSLAVHKLNTAIDKYDYKSTRLALQEPVMGLNGLFQECFESYAVNLFEAKKEKCLAGYTSFWVANVLKDGTVHYFNVSNLESSWIKPRGFKCKQSLMFNNVEIQEVITSFNLAFDYAKLLKANEPLIIKIQACIRGYLTRKSLAERQAFVNSQVPSVIKIQSWWRMIVLKSVYQSRRNTFQANVSSIIRIQAWWRMCLIRKAFLEHKEYYNEQIRSIVKIQTWYRANKAKKNYRALMENKNLAVNVVSRFVHLLDNSEQDFSEEIELTSLRHEVVKSIKSNQTLEEDLNTMDVKIGLLVRNRITLQDVITHNKNLKQHQSDRKVTSQSNLSHGLKQLTKESRKRLEAYQHLFYVLQTCPIYLAKLIFEMPQNRSTKFMESVILTLYNYGSNPREEFLMLKLFKTALAEEIDRLPKVEKMTDIMSGNPLVIRMIISFSRSSSSASAGITASQPVSNPISSPIKSPKSPSKKPSTSSLMKHLGAGNGFGNSGGMQNALREILGSLIKSTLADNQLKINTNPVEVYKQWVNSIESQSGKPSGLAYNVTVEEALKHPAVREKITNSIHSLKIVTERFLQVILDSHDKLPYVIRYTAKVLKAEMRKKFPHAPSKEILKVVGNLLYYRYINSAIVAPDAFDIIDVSSKNLTNDQRRNLGSIAKILQFIASNKGFGGESSHLACLNSYIMESHEKIKRFFGRACEVEEPEVYFNMDKFSDACSLTKPTIFISLREIVDTHQLLLEFEDAICSSQTDPLHDLLEDLGEVPSAKELLGDQSTTANSAAGDEASARTHMAKIEVLLTLNSKYDVINDQDDYTSSSSLYIRTKHMVIDIIRCQQGETLHNILTTPSTRREQQEHERNLARKDRALRVTSPAHEKLLSPNTQLMKERRMHLDRMKHKVALNLRQLEKAGMVTKEDGYMSIIRHIAQDIRNQRYYRARRHMELARIRQTLAGLKEKYEFLHEQATYYDRYLQSCLDNLNSRGKKSGISSGFFRGGLAASLRAKNGALSGSRRGAAPVHPGSGATLKSVKGAFKFPARELRDKGILLEIDGIDETQIKDVLFEIKATDVAGVFEVTAKYMGVSMETVDLIFQDLLQLQYENVTVMKIFNKAKVNVNLLIFLLNKKFYGK